MNNIVEKLLFEFSKVKWLNNTLLNLTAYTAFTVGLSF